MVQEVHHGGEIFKLGASHVNQGVAVLVVLEEVPEEGTGRDKDKLVHIQILTIVAGQGYICEVFVSLEVSKSTSDVSTEVIPLETELFTKHLLVLMDLFFSCYAISKFGLDWNGFTIWYDVSTALRVVYWPTSFLTMLTASRSGWIASCLWQDIDVI